MKTNTCIPGLKLQFPPPTHLLMPEARDPPLLSHLPKSRTSISPCQQSPSHRPLPPNHLPNTRGVRVPSLLQAELNSSFWLVRLFRVGLRPLCPQLSSRSFNTCPAARTCLMLPHSRGMTFREPALPGVFLPCLSSLSYSYSPQSSGEKPSDTPS